MNANKKYCLFPKPHFNHFLFLFYFISAMVRQYIFKGTKTIDSISVPIFKLYVLNIGDFLSIIQYLIIRKKTKSHNAELIKKKNNLLAKINYTDIFKKRKSKLFYIYLLCAYLIL